MSAKAEQDGFFGENESGRFLDDEQAYGRGDAISCSGVDENGGYARTCSEDVFTKESELGAGSGHADGVG